MKIRDTISIQKDVLFALLMREVKTRFDGFVLGNFMVIVEPVILATFYILIFGLRGRGEFGLAEPAVFVLSGIVVFRTLVQATIRGVKSAKGQIKGLMAYRQISLLDVYFSRALMNVVIFVIVLTFFIILFWWIGFDSIPAHILEVIGFSFVAWVLSLGLGIAVDGLSSYSKELSMVLQMIFGMPLLFLSAVLYPMTMIPDPYRTWLAYNPFVHVMELVREAWFRLYESPVADPYYLGMWTICTLAFALSIYTVRWRRLIAE